MEWWGAIPLWGLILSLVAFAASYGAVQVSMEQVDARLSRIEEKIDLLPATQAAVLTLQRQVTELSAENDVLRIRIRKLEESNAVSEELRRRGIPE